jgi:hypothetical protein
MANEQSKAAHEYATAKAAAYAAKFKRGVMASAVDAVYLHAYTHFKPA